MRRKWKGGGGGGCDLQQVQADDGRGHEGSGGGRGEEADGGVRQHVERQARGGADALRQRACGGRESSSRAAFSSQVSPQRRNIAVTASASLEAPPQRRRRAAEAGSAVCVRE